MKFHIFLLTLKIILFIFSSDNTILKEEGQTVEKGPSTSSYFSQFDSGVDSTENVNTGVFEAFASSEGSTATNVETVDQSVAETTVTNETLEWYKSQLEQYQQAINDWQVWSQSQLDEVAKLKV